MKTTCRKCYMNMAGRTIYQFPRNCGMLSDMVFCSYDCMSAWLFHNMHITRQAKDQMEEENTVEKSEKAKEYRWF